MKKRVLKEVGIYIFLLFFLALWMHYKQWFDHPLEHLQALPSSPFGLLHPFVFTFFVYILILIVRIFIHLIKRFSEKGAKRAP